MEVSTSAAEASAALRRLAVGAVDGLERLDALAQPLVLQDERVGRRRHAVHALQLAAKLELRLPHTVDLRHGFRDGVAQLRHFLGMDADGVVVTTLQCVDVKCKRLILDNFFRHFPSLCLQKSLKFFYVFLLTFALVDDSLQLESLFLESSDLFRNLDQLGFQHHILLGSSMLRRNEIFDGEIELDNMTAAPEFAVRKRSECLFHQHTCK
mmetsp:Transcript_6797/g.21252  ORF Transcript_6797/g.21252 Transcript_6797/m.21252 type:complete len:210 (-) Transcript_6797:132-761(-)